MIIYLLYYLLLFLIYKKYTKDKEKNLNFFYLFILLYELRPRQQILFIFIYNAIFLEGYNKSLFCFLFPYKSSF